MRTWRGLRVMALALLLAGCTHTRWQAQFATTDQYRRTDPTAPFLKVHTHAGDVYVLERWSLNEGDRVVRGHGLRYDDRRQVVDEGALSVGFERIALLETNRPRTVVSTGIPIMGIVTGASLAVTTACAINPKACFGSCPTFYADPGDGRGEILQAEGFSISIARSLEETDVDAIQAASVDGRVELLMRNEALETHLVRSVRLLAVPRPEGQRIVRSGDLFVTVDEPVPPSRCHVDGRDCLPQVAERDARELAPVTDPENLAARHTIELELPSTPGRTGLVISARNSFVSTFLFYQLLAWMGRSAGEWLAELDRAMPPDAADAFALGERLSDMRVLVEDGDGDWVEVGVYDELGPIARDVQLVPLPDDLPDGPIRVRLDLARGYWRIDWLAAAAMGERVEPTPLDPVEVRTGGHRNDEALARLLDPARYLVTHPTDAHRIVFETPASDSELFLESRGYYVEWIRRQWLAEEDPAQVARFFLDPEGTLRRLAPAFKRLEADAERIFWDSRIGAEAAW